MRDDAPADQQPADRRRTTPWLALLASIIVLAVVIGAAVGAIFIFRGGGPGPDLTEYFDEVEALVNDVSRRTGSGEFSSPRSVLIHLAVVLTETQDSLRSIKPPPEAVESHFDLVTALEDEALALANMADQDIDAQSTDELETFLVEDEELSTIVDRVTAACAELQKLADENEIEVELELC